MKKWVLTASKDAIDIDYMAILESEKEPDFWTCYELAEKHGCIYFTIEEY